MSTLVRSGSGPETLPRLGHRPGSAGYRRTVLALFAAGLATFMLLYSAQALLPELVTAFGVSPTQATLTMSLTTAGLAVALLVVGPVSDVIGRTRLIHLSLGASVLVAAACALAPTWESLLGLRLLEGVLLAGLPAVATAYLREELHPSSHARAAGLYIAGTAVGGMAGRLVAGGVAEIAGWRWALAATAGVGVLCAVAVLRLLPPSRGFVARSTDRREFGAMARRAVSDPGLLIMYAIGSCVIGVLVGVFNALGFRLTQGPFHLGVGTVSLIFLVYLLGSAASATAGRLADRYGRSAVVRCGGAIALVGVLITVPAWLPGIIAGVALLTIGFFTVHGVVSGWVPVRAAEVGVSTGQAASLYLCAYYVGSSVVGTLAGHAWAYAGWSGVAGLATLLLVISGALSIMLGREPSRPRPGR